MSDAVAVRLTEDELLGHWTRAQRAGLFNGWQPVYLLVPEVVWDDAMAVDKVLQQEDGRIIFAGIVLLKRPDAGGYELLVRAEV